MGEREDVIVLTDDETGEEFEAYVVDETKINETTYLLVCEDESDDGYAYILKEIAEEDGELTYETIEDDQEFEAVAALFEKQNDDIDFE